MEFELLLKVNFISTSVMVGVIWVIQLLHYPSFHFINDQKYIEFQHFHMQRISFIVVPVMLIELASALLLAYFFESRLDNYFISSCFRNLGDHIHFFYKYASKVDRWI